MPCLWIAHSSRRTWMPNTQARPPCSSSVHRRYAPHDNRTLRCQNTCEKQTWIACSAVKSSRDRRWHTSRRTNPIPCDDDDKMHTTVGIFAQGRAVPSGPRTQHGTAPLPVSSCQHKTWTTTIRRPLLPTRSITSIKNHTVANSTPASIQPGPQNFSADQWSNIPRQAT